MSDAVPGISVVCVYNDPQVRRACLDASVAAYSGSVDVDYVAIDNTEHAFTSAGAALNHGARLARHDVVCFVHQDVILHSLDRLAVVGRLLDAEVWGVLGASGVAANGSVVGRLRDRVQLIGLDADEPVAVDSLDEVLFMVRRDRVLEHPLSEDPDLAWHAYAVEYGMRMRELGLGVGAVNAGITHNSLTINLARLDVAHRRVATLHPQLLPAHTTCGVIGQHAKDWRDLPVVRDQRWRLRWARNSAVARRLRDQVEIPVVFADIRLDIDRLAHPSGAPLHVLDLELAEGFAVFAPATVAMTRYDRPTYALTCTSRAALLDAVRDVPAGETVLISELEIDDVRAVVGLHNRSDWLVGIHDGALWMLADSHSAEVPEDWSGERATPFGVRPLSRV